jgi:hypothetical protein
VQPLLEFGAAGHGRPRHENDRGEVPPHSAGLTIMKPLTRRTPITAIVVIALASAVLAACDDAEAPVNYYEVRIEADAPSPNDCREAVAIRFEPVRIEKTPPRSLYQTDTYSDQPVIEGHPVEDGPGNWECWFTYRSRDLAPGQWRIVGEFSTGTQSCVRDVGPGRPRFVRLDQEEGCVDGERPERP